MPPLTAKKLQKIGKKRGKIWEKDKKSGRKGKNQEGSFTLPLLTDRGGYTTALWGTKLTVKKNISYRKTIQNKTKNMHYPCLNNNFNTEP